jgi:exodeoxyribonuclease V alpha subunit
MEILEKIEGAVERIVFRNDHNGYTVADFDIKGTLITVVGFFSEISEGENYGLKGYRVDHHNYGQQFKVESYEIELPTSEEGILRYLSSGVLPGIGIKKAEDIIQQFGDETLNILDENPMRLTEVKGIGKKTAEKISQVYQEQRDMREIIIALQEYGLSSNYAMKLYKQYQKNTLSILLNNPYQMIEDIRGIGFKIADAIASQLGFEHEQHQRIQAGIQFCINKCYQEGNMYIPEEELIVEAGVLLGVEKFQIEDQLKEMALTGSIKIEWLDEKEVYYPFSLFDAENYTSMSLIRLIDETYEINIDEFEKKIKKYERDNNIQLGKKQKEAIISANNHGVMIITGGPGTGKTTIIKGIIELFSTTGLKVALAAPTGRAAKRMTETTGIEAMTIHRLLEYEYSHDEQLPYFAKNEDDKLDVNVLIIDETSMVDILLMSSLLKALPEQARLILVGDADQLPSVGPGNVLRDLIKSQLIKTVKLDLIYRQSEKSMIAENAHRINNGEMPVCNQKNTDFYFQKNANPNKILSTIIELMDTRLYKAYGYNTMQDVQVISPMKKGTLGVINLNIELQDVLNPPDEYKNEKAYGEITFREGDKVMQTKNNYRLEWENIYTRKNGVGIYNGDIGFVKEIRNSSKELIIIYDHDKKVKYNFSQMEELTHAYAMTVHKSQGNEFKAMIMPVIDGPPMLLNRNLLYTAVTRAKELVVLTGKYYCLEKMVENNRIKKRLTALKYRLIENKGIFIHE